MLYRAGRWVALLDYIDGLPAACRLNEAIVQDPVKARELAARQLEHQEDEEKEPWSPRTADFDLTATLLREIHSAIGGVQQAVIASVGGTPKPFKPFPIPRTAVDKAKIDLEKEFAREIIGMFGFKPEDL